MCHLPGCSRDVSCDCPYWWLLSSFHFSTVCFFLNRAIIINSVERAVDSLFQMLTGRRSNCKLCRDTDTGFNRVSSIISLWYFRFSFLYLFLGGKHNFLHIKSSYKKRKVLSWLKINDKMPTVAGTTQLFHPFPSSWDAPFPSSDGQWTDLIRRKWTSRCLFTRWQLCTNKYINIPLLKNIYLLSRH